MTASTNNTTIYINGRFLTQQPTGVQAFARSICREFINAGQPIVILISEKAPLFDEEFHEQIVRTGTKKGHLWEQLDLPLFMKKKTGSVLLNLCNTGPLSIKNQGVTIHDLAFIENPKWFRPLFRTWYKYLIPKLVIRCKVVFTVSETIKKELVSSLTINENKIVVIGNKVGKSLLDADAGISADMYTDANNYFLMVGSDDPRKNFAFVETYFKNLNKPCKLIIVGSKHSNFAKSTVIESKNIIRKGYTSLAELKWLYQNAIALINPSLYEGFGIPNLEAMAFNCPVLCSDIEVFREICKDAAIYFDNKNQDSLNDAIQMALENKMLMESNSLKGTVIFTELQSQNRTTKITKALF